MSRRVRTASTRKYPWSDIDPEQRSTLLLYTAIAGVILIALVIVAYGYYDQKVAPGRETVAQVGDRKFSYASFERRAIGAWQKNEIDSTDYSSISDGVGQVVSSMEQEEVIRQAARLEGVSVTEEELDTRLKASVGLAADADRNTLGASLRSELLVSKLDYDEYLEILEAELLEEKLQTKFTDAVPAQVEQADLRVIQTQQRQAADDAKTRINSGTDFATVAAEVSVHQSKSEGGELGWTPRGALSKELEDLVFAVPAGTVSDVIELEGNFFIFENRAQQVRDVDDEGRTSIVNRGLNDLLNRTREEVGSSITLTTEHVQRAIQALPPLPSSA